MYTYICIYTYISIYIYVYTHTRCKTYIYIYIYIYVALAQVILPGSPLWKRRTAAPPAMVVTSSGTTGMPGPSVAWRLQSIVRVSIMHP